MICAEEEIGIGDSHEGIIVLDDKHKAGKKISNIYDCHEDTIFDLALTPNLSFTAYIFCFYRKSFVILYFLMHSSTLSG